MQKKFRIYLFYCLANIPQCILCILEVAESLGNQCNWGLFLSKAHTPLCNFPYSLRRIGGIAQSMNGLKIRMLGDIANTYLDYWGLNRKYCILDSGILSNFSGDWHKFAGGIFNSTLPYKYMSPGCIYLLSLKLWFL